MTPDDNTKFASLCSHYKDTIDCHKNTLRTRDIFFLLSVIVSALFVSPDSVSSEIIKDVVKQGVGAELHYKKIIISLLWLSMVAISVKYFQININVDREYDYIHVLETEISEILGKESKAFTREGVAYLNNYPLFKDWMHLFYTWFFPIFITACPTVTVCREILTSNYSVLHIGCAVFMVISTTLYIAYIHPVKQFFHRKAN